MKRKTVKAYSKRFKQTGSGKIRKLKAGQNHFNSRETGKTTRNKRRPVSVASKKQAKLIRKLT